MPPSNSPLPLPSDSNEQQRPALAPPARGLGASDVAMRSSSIYGPRKASLALDIIVVGCGIGGLSAAFCLTQAGHRVTIIESYPVVGEFGAGIQLTPNSTRLLRRWGLGEHLKEVAIRPGGIAHLRYSTGERVGFTKLGETLEGNYGAAYYHTHRADLHKLLYDLVAPHVTILLGSTVTGCDPDPVSPSVTLKSGGVIRADLIVGADGVKSYIQQVVSGRPSPAEVTGDAVYRATIPASLLAQDPELRGLIEDPQMTVWVGPGKFTAGYLIRKELYYIILLYPDGGSVKSWTSEGKLENMRRDFVEFEPRARKLISLATSVIKWRVVNRKPLDKWVHESGHVVLLGDACHPILPYRAQGAALAIEDAAVLGNILSRISYRSQLRPLLGAYQDLRFDRAATAQEASRLYRITVGLPDGPEQRERDEKLRKAMALELSSDSGALELESDGARYLRDEKKKMDALYGYDADAEVDKWWAAHGKEFDVLARSKL